MTKSLSLPRTEHAILLEKYGETAALLASKDSELAEVETRLEKKSVALRKAPHDIATLKVQVLRSDSSSHLVQREITFLRSFNDSLKNEASIELDEEPSISDGRVALLEELLEEDRSKIAEFEHQINYSTIYHPPTPLKVSSDPSTETRIAELTIGECPSYYKVFSL